MTVMQTEIDINETARIIDAVAIPPCPVIIAEVVHEAVRPAPDAQKIVRLISTDPALSTAILQSVNSPLRGLRQKVTTLGAALNVIGLRGCTNLIASLLLHRMLRAMGDSSTLKFWDANVQIGVIIAYLARELGVADFNEAHTFGLFRHCGVPLLMARYPGYRGFIEAAHAAGSPAIAEQERSRFDVDHAAASSVFARAWRLPESIWLPIRLHHVRDNRNISQSSGPAGGALKLVAIAVLADCLDWAHRQAGSSSIWEQEEAFARRVLGVGSDDLEPLRSDVALMLEGG